ncbi:hypothetical protein D3C87_1675290 [compost metagenome]
MIGNYYQRFGSLAHGKIAFDDLDGIEQRRAGGRNAHDGNVGNLKLMLYRMCKRNDGIVRRISRSYDQIYLVFTVRDFFK